MRIAILGQPNAGKSTIFNAVAGYKSASSNFSGTTVQYTESTVRLNGMIAEILDFPGCYSFSATSEAEFEIREYLLTNPVDVIIGVLDASQLGRGLPLIIELMEFNIPLILSLNMMDEADRKGMEISTDTLSSILSLPVVETIASKNIGIRELFDTVRTILTERKSPNRQSLRFQKDVEQIVTQMEEQIPVESIQEDPISARFLAIKLLEDDSELLQQLHYQKPDDLLRTARRFQYSLENIRGKPGDTVLTMERNALAQEIVNHVTTVHHPKKTWYDKLDDILMHRFWGYIIMALLIGGIFYLVFGVGAGIEAPLLEFFDRLEAALGQVFDEGGLWYTILQGALFGISGGVAIVLPYLIPFLLVLSVLEDAGYIPRIAYLMDSFMHRIGLHGTAVLPVLLGYGCTVPAIMATRILPSRRDKVITGLIATLVPCSARSVVILSLVGFYLGAPAALFIYVLNIAVIAIAGKIMASMMPQPTPGMIMEVPPYRWPVPVTVLRKVWFRIREFIVIAWPLLIIGSIIVSIANYFHWTGSINELLSPLTVGILGLPVTVGMTLVFGVLRKELSLIMLVQAIGTTNVLAVMSAGEIMTFAVFVTFYIPCVATIATLYSELGWRWMMVISLFTLILAVLLAFLIKSGYLLLL